MPRRRGLLLEVACAGVRLGSDLVGGARRPGEHRPGLRRWQSVTYSLSPSRGGWRCRNPWHVKRVRWEDGPTTGGKGGIWGSAAVLAPTSPAMALVVGLLTFGCSAPSLTDRPVSGSQSPEVVATASTPGPTRGPTPDYRAMQSQLRRELTEGAPDLRLVRSVLVSVDHYLLLQQASADRPCARLVGHEECDQHPRRNCRR